MAVASGCSECCSLLAIKLNKSPREIVPKVSTSVKLGFPSVIVPVLSRTTVFTIRAASRTCPDLIRTPFSAPFPVPTIIAVGVANPSAQGQAMTSTAMKIESENCRLLPATKNHARAAKIAKSKTIGTK